MATAWETHEITMYMSSPIVENTTVYGMSDKQRGSLFIMNASDGSVVWRGEGRLGANASLTDVGSAILVMTDTGELIVQEKARTSLKELAKFKVANSPVWASPAVVGDQIFIKDKTTLALYKVVDGD